MRKTFVFIAAAALVVITFAVPPSSVLFLAGWLSHPRTRAWRTESRARMNEVLREINAFVMHKYAQQKYAIWLGGAMVSASFVFLVMHFQAASTSDFVGYCFEQVLATISLGVAILALAWVYLPIEWLVSRTLVKFILPLVVSVCVLVSRLLATDFFSTAFPVPPSYVPNAFWVGTILITSAFASIGFAALTLVFEIIALIALSAAEWKKEHIPIWMFAVFASIGLVGAYVTSFAAIEGIQPKGQLFMIKLAQKYDFTTNHMCEAAQGEAVLFIDNVADRAIAATFPGEKIIKVRGMTGKALKDYMPKAFHTVRCNPLAATAAAAGWCRDDPSRFGFCDAGRQAAEPAHSDSAMTKTP